MINFFHFCLLLSVGEIMVSAVDDVELKFVENEIQTDLNLESAPKRLVEVSYPSGVKAELGNELAPTQVKDQPELKWKHEQGALYAVLMTDPDAPSRKEPTRREFRHWLVVNVPKNDIKNGDPVFDYIGSGPPKDTGLHRYVFVVFKQNGRIDLTNTPRTKNCSSDRRPNSSTKKLIEEFKLGEPLFGNFYQAQYDNYVPTLHKQLSGC